MPKIVITNGWAADHLIMSGIMPDDFHDYGGTLCPIFNLPSSILTIKNNILYFTLPTRRSPTRFVIICDNDSHLQLPIERKADLAIAEYFWDSTPHDLQQIHAHLHPT